MKLARGWLILTALAFAAWIGYLFYLTRGVEKPPIHLSRPQFQVAEAVVVAHLEDEESPARALEVVFTTNDNLQPGVEIRIANLRNSFHKWFDDGGPPEWEVPGDFIVPLRMLNQGTDQTWTAEVVPLPPSPGLPHGTRIYPKTPATMKELRAIPVGLQ
jgi:hypothetical protein